MLPPERSDHIHVAFDVTVQTCGDLRAIRPLTEGRPSTEFALSDCPLKREQLPFDDHGLVANAGLLLPITLAHHLGLGGLVNRHVDLGDAPGRAHAGGKAADPSDVGAGWW